MSRVHVLVINLDNIAMTRDCLLDLMRQRSLDFDLTVVDNASTEIGTKELFDEIEKHFRVWRYTTREPLNWIWNRFYKETDAEFLCYLNNDTRLPYNYIETIAPVFDKEKDVGIVGHVTNNETYSEISDELKYEVFFKRMRQGWDYTIRKSCYFQIPEQFKVFYGDDLQYNGIYDNGMRAALILNAPIIHYMGSSGKSCVGTEYGLDRIQYLAMGFKEGYSDWSGLSVIRPKFKLFSFFKIKEEPILTINIVSYERIERLRNIIHMFLSQTDKRFVLDIWNDGNDSAKFRMICEFCDARIRYNENPTRQNKYGHDMRNKSLLNCKTEWWCTTNDDNSVSPYFVEDVIKNINDCDAVKIGVAMENIPRGPRFDGSDNMLLMGDCDPGSYDKIKVLDVNEDACGEVDACSFVIKKTLGESVGWWDSELFHGDWLFWEKILKTGRPINRIPKILAVHR